MKKFILVVSVFVYSAVVGQTESSEGWSLFARVKFDSKFIKEVNGYFLVPQFDSKIKSLIGKEVIVKGYYMPFELPKNQLIISRYPYSSCFFCGGAGPESIAEAVLKTKAPKLKVDQIITVKGKLKLNNSDVDHMNFILEEAEIIGN